MLLHRLLVAALAVAAGEVVLPLPNATGFVALSTRGDSSIRVRLLPPQFAPPFDSPMVAPEAPDATFKKVAGGIVVEGVGSTLLSADGRLSLLDARGATLVTSRPLEMSAQPSVVFESAGVQRLYGRGGGTNDGTVLATSGAVTPRVENCNTYVPYFYSTAGYAALGAVNSTSGPSSSGYGGTNVLPARYTLSADGKSVSWSWEASTPGFELYLMPASTLDAGTASYLGLIGTPVVPPMWSFGFIMCRWGWSNRTYIEDTLTRWRSGRYPADAFIMDFGWFTNVSDYGFPPSGFPDYNDFGFHNATLPQPREQLATYRDKLHFRMGGIRKPRLGNSKLLDEARALGLLLPGGEASSAQSVAEASIGVYAQKRNLNFSSAATRQWYEDQMRHYLDDGVEFWWNDEGETDYFTFYHWSASQREMLRSHNASKRFFSLSRSFSPGLARLGGAVWTGDIKPTWDELRNTPGLVLNWGLAGMPYVACDIGGFTGETNAELLTRWYQLGALMPIMRTHSILQATPHWPWLWGERYANAMRSALELRYRLLPYHYSCAHLMRTERRLWMRPLLAEWPDDDDAHELTHEWMDGPSLLAAPVVHKSGNYSTYLPAALWFEFNSSRVHQGPTTLSGQASPLEAIPIFVRAPALVPLAPLIQHTGELPGGALEVQIYATGHATNVSFSLMEDDGETTSYAIKGAFRNTTFTWAAHAATLLWEVHGDAPGGFTEVCVTLFRPGASRIVSAPWPIRRGGHIVLPTGLS